MAELNGRLKRLESTLGGNTRGDTFTIDDLAGATFTAEEIKRARRELAEWNHQRIIEKRGF